MMHLGIALYIVLAFAQVTAATSTVVDKKQLTISFANKGAKLFLTTYGGPLPFEPRERLELETAETRLLLRGLSDLTGAVHIDSAAVALEYVRLRTSLATWYLWRDGQTVEVLDNATSSALPNYGLRTRVANPASSGYMGILSSIAFKQGKFASATTSSTADGFVVTRWLLNTSRGKSAVQFVQEEIGRTGAYKRVTLKEGPVPQLPGTTWFIMKFE